MSNEQDPFRDWREGAGQRVDPPESPVEESRFDDPESPAEPPVFDPPPGPREIRIGLVGFPNSGKTSFIHAVRNSTAAMGRGFGVWDFGGINAESGNLVGRPGATPSGYFRVAPFCRMRRVRLRLGSWRLSWPERTLLMPEVAGEIPEAIAKGSDRAQEVPNTGRYLQFLSQSPGILCFISLDGGYAGTEGHRLDPEREIQKQLLDIRKVLEATDEARERPRGWFRMPFRGPPAQAVSVLITKIDLLRDHPQLDTVTLPVERSAVARCARAARRGEVREELKRHGSDQRLVTFRVWDLVTHRAASRDLDLQEAIAADFLKCHAPDSAKAMADLQRDISRGSRRSVRFFLSAPYGRSFSVSRKRGHPDPSELRPVLLFEPLESVIERASAARSRLVSRTVPLLLALLLLSPLLTWAALAYARAGMNSPSRTADSLLWRADLVGFCPQVLAIEWIQGVAAWYPDTRCEVAKCYRDVALCVDRLQDGDHAEEIRALRRAAVALHEDPSEDGPLFRDEAQQLWNSLESSAKPSGSPAGGEPAALAQGTLQQLSADFDKRFADWRYHGKEFSDRLERLRKLVEPSRGSSPAATDALLKRCDRLQACIDLATLQDRYQDPVGLIRASSSPQAREEAAARLRQLDEQRMEELRRLRQAFHAPRDLATWPRVDQSSAPAWLDLVQPVWAREALQSWLSGTADGLAGASQVLAGRPSDPSAALEKAREELASLLDGVGAPLPEWCAPWSSPAGGRASMLTEEESKAIEGLRDLSGGFALLERTRQDPSKALRVDGSRLKEFIGADPRVAARCIVASRTIEASAVRAAIGRALRDELLRRLPELALTDNGVVKVAIDLFPQDDDFRQLTAVSEQIDPLRTVIEQRQPWGKVVEQLETVWRGAAKRSPGFQKQVARAVQDMLLSGADADVSARLGQMDPAQCERVEAVLEALGCSQEFGARVTRLCLRAAQAAAGRGDESAIRASLRSALAFGDGRTGRWRNAGEGLTLAIREKFSSATDARDLESRGFSGDLSVLRALSALRPKSPWPKGEDPGAMADALTKARDLIRDFAMVKVKGDGKDEPDAWIGKREIRASEAEAKGIVPKGLLSRRAPGVPESALSDSVVSLQDPAVKGLAKWGLRLPRRSELDRATARRSKPAGADIPASDQPNGTHPEKFVTPESLDTLDCTNEGVVGLVYGVDELCTREGKVEVFEGKPNIAGRLGFRVALELLPAELVATGR